MFRRENDGTRVEYPWMVEKKNANKKVEVHFEVDTRKWMKRSFWTWVLTLIVFGGLIYYLAATDQTILDRGAQWSWYVMVTDVFVGILAFLSTIVFKVSGRLGFKAGMLIVGVILLIGGVGLASAYFEETKKNQPERSLSPTATSTGASTPIPIESAISTVPTSTTKKTNTQSLIGTRTGEIVKYKEWCSGKEINIYQNEIIEKVSSIDGKTYGMTQGDWDCYLKKGVPQAVVVPQATSTTNRVSVYIPYLNAIRKCPPENVVAVQGLNAEIEKKKPEAQSNFSSCQSLKSTTDPCNSSCSNAMSYDYQACTNAYGFNTAEWKTCASESDSEFSICISKCTSIYDLCSYTYSEINSMLDKINQLCK